MLPVQTYNKIEWRAQHAHSFIVSGQVLECQPNESTFIRTATRLATQGKEKLYFFFSLFITGQVYLFLYIDWPVDKEEKEELLFLYRRLCANAHIVVQFPINKDK